MHKFISQLFSVFALVMVAAPAFAADGSGDGGTIAIAAGLAIGIAALGGTLAQGRAAAAALEGLARNPEAQVFTPMVIGLALIESLVLFAWLIAFFLQGKI